LGGKGKRKNDNNTTEGLKEEIRGSGKGHE